MRVRLVGAVAAVATVALAVFAATGFGGESSDLRSLEPGFDTERVDVDELRRVAAPSGHAGASGVAEASKKKGKVKFLYFETEAQPVAAGESGALDLPCPRGKVATGYFGPDQPGTFLGASLPTSARSWLVGVTNVSTTPTNVIFGVVCASGVK